MSAVLEPLLSSGVFVSGPGKLTCSVGGRVYTAALGVNGEILCNCGCLETYRSPSAFSVHIKRKLNPARKADDGWTSTKYMGVALSRYRGALEQLASTDNARYSSPSVPAQALLSLKKQKRKKHQLHISPPDGTEVQDNSNSAAVLPADTLKRSVANQPDQQRAAAGHKRRNGYPTPSEALQCCTLLAESALLPQSQSPAAGAGGGGSDGGSDGGSHLSNGNAAADALGSSRPPLHLCTEPEFEANLISFLEANGDGHLAAAVRDKRITCNHTPLDLLGLYLQVVAKGGLADNEQYDDRGRWNGGINFAGEVFPKLKNYTPNNRATSVGNQLLNNYKKFLLAYEQAHRRTDIAAPAKAATAAAAARKHGIRAVRAAGFMCAAEIESQGDVMHVQDRLAVLAEVAEASSSPTLQQLHEQQQQQQEEEEEKEGKLLIAAGTDNRQQQLGLTEPPPWIEAPEACRPVAKLENSPVDLVQAPPHRKRLVTSDDTSSSSYSYAFDQSVDEIGTTAAAEADRSNSWQADQLQPQQLCNQKIQPQQQVQTQPLPPEASSGHSSSSQHGMHAPLQNWLGCQQAGAAEDAEGAEPWWLPGSMVLVRLQAECTQMLQLQQGAAGRLEQQQVWAAVVADVNQLPVNIADVGLTSHRPALQQQQQQHMADPLLPILLLGTQKLLWVSCNSCQPATLAGVHAALSLVWSNIDPVGQTSSQPCGHTFGQDGGLAGTLGHSLNLTGTQLQRDLANQQLLSCVHGMKQAAQWLLSCSEPARAATKSAIEAATTHPQLHVQQQQMLQQQQQQQPGAWVTAAGLKCVSEELLLLEAQLPLEAVANRSSWFWQGWRAAVAAASTPGQLSQQVLVLVHQAEAALRAGVQDAMWAELEQLLGMQTHCASLPSAPQTNQELHRDLFSCVSEEFYASRLLPAQLQGPLVSETDAVPSPSCTPNVLNISKAVQLLAAAMDWPRLQQLWQTGCLRQAACSAPVSRASQHCMPGDTGRFEALGNQQRPLADSMQQHVALDTGPQQLPQQQQAGSYRVAGHSGQPLLQMLTYGTQTTACLQQGMLHVPPPLPLDLGCLGQHTTTTAPDVGRVLGVQNAQQLLEQVQSRRQHDYQKPSG